MFLNLPVRILSFDKIYDLILHLEKQLTLNDLQYLLKHRSETELFAYLKSLFIENKVLSEVDLSALKTYESTNYGMIGLIGLLINSKARILLGKKQGYYSDIQNWCNAIETTDEDLILIADQYLEDDFEVEPEFILRKVMLEYPYEGLSED